MGNNIQGLAHIGIPCENLARAVDFYGRLGFATVAAKNAMNGYNVAMVEKDGCIIELYQSLDDSVFLPGGNGSVDHLALRCTGIKELYAEACAQGLMVVTDGIESNDLWAPKTCRYFTVLGPNRERVEFCQVE